MEENENVQAPAQGQVGEPTKRDRLMERLRSRNAERSYETDDDMYDAIMSDYDEMERSISESDAEREKILGLFSKDPKSARFFTSLVKGGNPMLEMMELYGDDFTNALNDPELREPLAERHAKWLETVARNKELEDEAERNLDTTIANLNRMKEENGWTDEQVMQIYDTANRIFMDGTVNIISPETIDIIAKSLNFDNAVAEAEEVGRVRGRNEKIEEKLRKGKPEGEMPPTLGGAGGKDPEKKKRRYYNPFVAGSYVERDE